MWCAPQIMHTGVISFCDRIAYNIKSSDTKDDIMLELSQKFQLQILQRHWHRLDEEGMVHIQRSPHFTCLRSNGNPYYVYFTRYEDVPIIYYIDKKIQPGYQKPRIILGRGKWKDDVYQNTLLDGEMVKDKFGGWVFLINDVIGFKGIHLWKETLPERLEIAYKMLHELYVHDTYMDVCQFQVKKYAHATQEGVHALIDLSKELPYTSRGIYFWPFYRKFKPKLYNFDETLIKSVVRKVKDTPDFRERVPSPQPSSQSSGSRSRSRSESPIMSVVREDKRDEMKAVHSDERKLWLRKTELPDVYDVYNAMNGMMIANSKLGVAHIPSLAISKTLRSEFKDATVAVYIPFMCRFDATFQRWIPLMRLGE